MTTLENAIGALAVVIAQVAMAVEEHNARGVRQNRAIAVNAWVLDGMGQRNAHRVTVVESAIIAEGITGISALPAMGRASVIIATEKALARHAMAIPLHAPHVEAMDIVPIVQTPTASALHALELAR